MNLFSGLYHCLSVTVSCHSPRALQSVLMMSMKLQAIVQHGHHTHYAHSVPSCHLASFSIFSCQNPRLRPLSNQLPPFVSLHENDKQIPCPHGSLWHVCIFKKTRRPIFLLLS